MPQVVQVRAVDAAALNAVRRPDGSPPEVRWDQDIGNKYGTATVGLTEELGFRPGEDDYLGITRTDGPTREFSGLVVAPSGKDVPGERDYSYAVEAVGFGALLDRIRIPATQNWPANTPDGKMVQDLVDLCWGAISTTATHVIRSRRVDMPAMTALIGSSLRSALDAIAKEAWHAPYWVGSHDAGMHWNDRPLAPFILWAPADGGVLKSLDDPTFATLEHLGDRIAGRGKALRVRVVGNGVEATVVDGVGFARVSKRLADEPGAPSARYWDLPDVNDNDLLTVTQCRRRGWAELAKVASARTLEASTAREGYAAGELVDLLDEQMGPLTVPYPRRRSRVPSWSGYGLHRGQGRFRIQRLEAEAVGSAEYRYRLDLGAYEQPFAVGLTRS